MRSKDALERRVKDRFGKDWIGGDIGHGSA